MQTELLRSLAENFESNSVRSGKAIRDIYLSDPRAFPRAVLEILDSTPDLPAAQFLVAVLASEPDWLRSFCSPEKYTLDQTLDLIGRARTLDPLIELKLAEMLTVPGSMTDGEARFSSRVFAVLGRSRPSAALPALRQLSKSTNAHVRSKAVLLIGRIHQNHEFAQRGEFEQDPRVAANAIESLWGLDTDGARETFMKAALHRHHRIAANGIVGLYQMGDECGIPYLFHLSRSPAPLSRASAAWAMGRLGDPRFLPRLAQLREDSDPVARQSAIRSAARVRKRSAELEAAGTLRLQPRGVELRATTHAVRVEVTREEQPVNNLDSRRFLLWSGADLIEEFSSTLCDREAACYEIKYQQAAAPSNPSENQPLKVQVYADCGVGEAADLR